MTIHQEKRGTGRTHNMIMEALHMGSGHKGAAVVMLEHRDIKHAVQQIVPRCVAHEYLRIMECKGQFRVLVNGQQVIVFLTADKVARDYGNNRNAPHEWRVHGLETLIDHRVIENFFGSILEAWSRYDNPHHKVNFHG